MTANVVGGDTVLSINGSLDTSPFGTPDTVTTPAAPFTGVFNDGGILGGSGVAGSTSKWGGPFAIGHIDFNLGFGGAASSSTFTTPGSFFINAPDLSLFLPGDFTVPGIFAIADSMTFSGTTPAALGWDLTPFDLTLPGGQFIHLFHAANDPALHPVMPVNILTVDTSAINSANTTGVFLPNAQSTSQNNIISTTLNALHNQRIVRARSGMGNPRAENFGLANSDRKLGSYLSFARNQGMTSKQALGLEDVPASLVINDAAPFVSNFFSVEQQAGGKACVESPKRWEVFAVGDYGTFDQSALDIVNRGFQSRTTTGSVGVEYFASENLNVGAAYTYADNNTDLDEGLGNVDIEGHLASIYATAFWEGNTYFDVLYSYGNYENEIVRNTLTAGGFATGAPDSDSHTMSLNAGKNFEFGDLVTGPTFGFDYTEGDIEAYNESGGGVAALNYQNRGYRSSITSLGWQVSRSQCMKNGVLTVQGFASWDHEFEPEAGNVRASLATSPFAINGIATGGFNINRPGAAPGTDWMSLGVGARLATCRGWGIEIDYQTQLFREDVEAHYVGAKISGQF